MGVQINGDTGNISATKADYSGNVTIGGTLTYEDVTNVDSVGLITARQGIKIGSGVGVAASISVDGNAEFAGIVTATTFKGDGSQLSNITSTTINSNADNRVITGSGTANTLNGESTLTYDSGGMAITGDTDRDGYKITQSGNNYGEFMFNSNRSSSGNALGVIRGEWNSTEVASIYISAGSDTTNKDDGQINFYTSPSSGTGIQNRMTISPDGYVTKPNLPYFNATANPSITSNYIHSFSNVHSNNGSHYDNSNGRFTAPVAGFYWFGVGIWCDSSDDTLSDLLELVRVTGGSDSAFGGCNHRTQYNQLIISAGTYMAKDAYVFIRQTNISIRDSTPRNYFSGYLVG